MIQLMSMSGLIGKESCFWDKNRDNFIEDSLSNETEI